MVVLASSNMRLAIVVEVMAILYSMRKRETRLGRAEMTARLQVPAWTEAGVGCVGRRETRIASTETWTASSAILTKRNERLTVNIETAMASSEATLAEAAKRVAVEAAPMPKQTASSRSLLQQELLD